MLSGAKAQNIINVAMQSPVLRVGGNSTITRVDFEQRSYAVKDYSARADGYQRLTQDFSTQNSPSDLPNQSVSDLTVSALFTLGLTGPDQSLNKNVSITCSTLRANFIF
jgi:hypothetical protein